MLQEWQRRRENRMQISAAAAAAAASAAESESRAEETASEAEFLLSDQSEDDPLPLDQHAPADSDSEVSVHSKDSATSHSSRPHRPNPGLSDKLLELALASDAEDNDEPQEGVKEAEAEVLKAVLSASRFSTHVQGEPAGGPAKQLCVATSGAEAGGGPQGDTGVSASTEGDSGDRDKAAKKRRKVAARAKFSRDTAGGPQMGTVGGPQVGPPAAPAPTGAAEGAEALPAGLNEGPSSDSLVHAFDCPDTSKRRVQKTVSAGGWLGAGALRRQKPTQEEKRQNISTSSSSNGEAQQDPTDAGARKTEEAEEETHFIPKLTVLPLYATLPRELQRLAFEPPAPDERRMIIATNVAETSLTLPNVRCVSVCKRLH